MKGFKTKIMTMKEKESEFLPTLKFIKRRNKLSKEDKFLKLNKDKAEEILRNKTLRGCNSIKSLSKNINYNL